MKNSPRALGKNAEAELDACIDKFSPEMAKAIRAVRAALRKKVPAANELVYDNYNFFVIGYGPTLRPSDIYFSIAADAHAVRIAFYWGSKLPDPSGILMGSGSQNRFLRLESARDLAKPDVDAVIRATIKQGKALPEKGRGTLVIRSISSKQRPRRAAEKKKPKR